MQISENCAPNFSMSLCPCRALLLTMLLSSGVVLAQEVGECEAQHSDCVSLMQRTGLTVKHGSPRARVDEAKSRNVTGQLEPVYANGAPVPLDANGNPVTYVFTTSTTTMSPFILNTSNLTVNEDDIGSVWGRIANETVIAGGPFGLQMQPADGAPPYNAPAPPPPTLEEVNATNATTELESLNLTLEEQLIANLSSLDDAEGKETLKPLKKKTLTKKMKEVREKASLDCQVGDWGPWSPCQIIGGDMTESKQISRMRNIVQNQLPGGKPCGLRYESALCEDSEDPLDVPGDTAHEFMQDGWSPMKDS